MSGTIDKCSEDSEDTLDFLVMGKTGNGKSELSNMLIGKEDYFNSSSNMTSETNDACIGRGEFGDKCLSVVDTTGTFDTRKDREESISDLVNQTVQAVALNNNGFHSLLLVLCFGTKFTNEELESIKIFEKLYGKDFIEKHCVIIMTHGDNFERKEKITFDEWCAKQKGAFKILLAKCQDRILLFDNLDMKKRNAQVGKLTEMAMSIVQTNGRYNSEIFNTAKSLRDKLLAQSKHPRLSKKVDTEIKSCTQEFVNIKSYSKNKKKDFEKLSERLDHLYGEIKDADHDTGVFNELLNSILIEKHLIQEGKYEEAEKMNREIAQKTRNWWLIGMVIVGGVCFVAGGVVVYAYMTKTASAAVAATATKSVAPNMSMMCLERTMSLLQIGVHTSALFPSGSLLNTK